MNESESKPESAEYDEIPTSDDADEEIFENTQDVPVAVLEAFHQAFPNALDVTFDEDTRDGQTVYEIEFTNQDLEVEATYSADGAFLKLKEEILPDDLPEAVTGSILKVYPDAIFIEAEKIVGANGSVSGYKIDIEDDEVELEIHLDADGVILETD